MVVGLPRGGVPVAAVVAAVLGAPLDIIVVRKLGVPHQPELGMGAIGEGGARVLNQTIVEAASVTPQQLAEVEARERQELERRAQLYRSGRSGLDVGGRTVIIVDDGIATGSTARVACEVARAHGARRVVLALPVAPVEWTARLAGAADEFVAVATPEPFFGVGQFYRDFSPTSDREVTDLLAAAVAPTTPAASTARHRPRDEDVVIPVGGAQVEGHLVVPDQPRAVVLFAHGSGSGRFSPRNRFVAGVLNEAGLATLLFDLLTSNEELHRHNVFDIELLGERLEAATRWVWRHPGLVGLPVGYFGASTGAAAALDAAARLGGDIAAVVSRGGRPDLAEAALAEVNAPTLLIVGGRDDVVLDLNRRAQTALTCPNALEVIAGAGHLFEEPGTLAAAAAAACEWFVANAAT